MKRILFLFLLLSSQVVNSQTLTQSAVQDTINKEIKSPLGVLNIKRTLGVINRFAGQPLTNISQSSVVGLTASLAAKQNTLVSGTTIKTINGTSILGSGNIAIAGAGGDVTLDGAQTLTNKVLSGASNFFSNISQSSVVGLTASLTAKQDVLVSGTSIKTINGSPILGAGDIVISAGGGDATLGTAQTFSGSKTFSSFPTFTDTYANGQARFGATGQAGRILFLDGTNGGSLFRIGYTSSSAITPLIESISANGLNISASNATTGNISLSTGGTESARLLANGNLLIGTTTDNSLGKIQVTGTSYLGGVVTVAGNVVSSADNTINLGSISNRFANVYTGNVTSPGTLFLNSGSSSYGIQFRQNASNLVMGGFYPTTGNFYTQTAGAITTDTGENNQLGGTTRLGGNVTLSGNIIPALNTTYNLGQSSTRFGTIYGVNIFSDAFLSTSGSSSAAFGTNTTTASIQFRQGTASQIVGGYNTDGTFFNQVAGTVPVSTGEQFQNYGSAKITGATSIGGTLTVRAGTATAGTAPMKFISGPLLTTPEVGAQEFLTDDFWATITTGAARKKFVLADATAGLTTGRVPYTTTNGRLLDGTTFLFNTTAGGRLSVGTTASTSNFNVGATATASGNTPLATFTGAAHTAQTASTELTDVYFNLARNVQFATGAQSVLRPVRVTAPTYSFVAASTVAKASTVSISGAPIAGTNATITAPYALEVETGNALFGGQVSVTTIPALGTAASTYLTSNGGVISSRTTSQLATDIGAMTNSSVATLTNKTIDFGAGVNTAQNIPTSAIRTADLQVFDPTIYALKTRVGTTASSATPTIDVSLYDQYNITALAANATISTTGTPADGQSLLIRAKDNSTARTLTFATIFRAGTDIALPTTTTAGKTMYIQFIYNAADAKFDLTGITQGF